MTSSVDVESSHPSINEWNLYTNGEVIVTFKPGLVGSLSNTVRAEVNAVQLAETRTLGMELWQLDPSNLEAGIAQLSDNPWIEYIEPNYIITTNATTPNDPDFSRLWGLNNTGQTGGTADADIDAPEAWDIQRESDVVVGVIDTGVDYNHPDLRNNMWTNPGEIPNNGIDDDGNGFVDDYYGYDFVNDDGDPFDDNGHGTHVAGTIAAEGNNGIGISGVSWSAQIMALKFLDENGSGYTFDAVQAIDYAVQMGADLTNNSWGGGGFSQSLYDAIAAAGDAEQLFIAAAGNGGSDRRGDDNDTTLHSPSSYDLDNIISVAATDHRDQLASFSNYGQTSVDLGAPGVRIYSTLPGDRYGYLSGTSMAAPHVAGVASLVLAQNPNLSALEVKEAILGGVDPVSSLQGMTVTGGRLNASGAIDENEAPQITFGRQPASFELSSLDGRNGFVLNGRATDDRSGRSVSSAGDINGDGLDDLIIGADMADPNGLDSGQSYVVFGRRSGFNANVELADLDGINGFALNGSAGDVSGIAVSSAGDVNGDGFDDLIIGANKADPNGKNSGQSYVVFGRSSGFSASLELASLDGSNGFALNGSASGDLSGASVSSAGDVNGDGLDDLIIGAYAADPNGGNSGQSYVVFGRSSGFSASVELAGLDGSNGFALNGGAKGDWLGNSVSSAGDVNGDGLDDLIIGARDADPNGKNSGQSYVVFGRSSGFSASLELTSLDGSNGFALNGSAAGDWLGRSVSSAGDINGDGLDDLIIGAPRADPNGKNSGQSYVVFGRSSGFNASLDLASLDGSNGFALNGSVAGDFSGWSVSGAGDVNSDGLDDLIIGARGADPNGNNSGRSYVVFGSISGFSASLDLASLDGTNGFALNGSAVGDQSGVSVSSAGDVNGDGRDDLIIGADRADPNGSASGQSYVVLHTTLATVTVPENIRTVATITASDADNDSLNFAISGGDDSALFTMDTTTGDLAFINAPDFENPHDADGDNLYLVEVAVADGNGGRDTQLITVDVTDVDDFNIEINFADDTLSDSQRAIFSDAASRWAEIIIDDIPDIVVDGIGLVDDIVIDASAPFIDGDGGILGQAGPTRLRPDGSFLPATGIMHFDAADVANLEANGQLEDVILHEMGHVLGIGTIWDGLDLLTGAGSDDPRFIGAQATAEYNSIFGLDDASVPVANTGGIGTRDAHWRESVFRNELLTGFLNSGMENPISRVTIGSLADIGYGVNLDAADPYAPPSPLVVGSQPSEHLHVSRPETSFV